MNFAISGTRSPRHPIKDRDEPDTEDRCSPFEVKRPDPGHPDRPEGQEADKDGEEDRDHLPPDLSHPEPESPQVPLVVEPRYDGGDARAPHREGDGKEE